jgi:hypothetical protein
MFISKAIRVVARAQAKGQKPNAKTQSNKGAKNNGGIGCMSGAD